VSGKPENEARGIYKRAIPRVFLRAFFAFFARIVQTRILYPFVRIVLKCSRITFVHRVTGGILLIRLLGGVIIALFPAAALAADAGASAQPGIPGLQFLPIVLMIVVLYFFVYRPQKKKQQQHDQMISSITRGDTVVTAGGFFGKVLDILDDSYILELDAGVKARILKGSVQNKRESDDKFRPKKLRKKRRIVRHDATTEPEKTAETPQSQASREEGVSVEENEALFEELRDAPERAGEIKREMSDGDGGNPVNADTK
jgi:preprotein translocase subunit YajC